MDPEVLVKSAKKKQRDNERRQIFQASKRWLNLTLRLLHLGRRIHRDLTWTTWMRSRTRVEVGTDRLVEHEQQIKQMELDAGNIEEQELQLAIAASLNEQSAGGTSAEHHTEETKGRGKVDRSGSCVAAETAPRPSGSASSRREPRDG